MNSLNTENSLQIEQIHAPTSLAPSYSEDGDGPCFIPNRKGGLSSGDARSHRSRDIIVNAPSKVQWDDFLDHQSLLDISYSGEHPPNVVESINFPNDISFEANKEEKRGKKPKRKVASKRSAINIKAQVTIQKAEPSFRKEKYSTAVKTWLDHMDKNTGQNSPQDDSTSNSYSSPAQRILVESVKMSKKQKFTQSQLANKNGVMKFTKPGETGTNESYAAGLENVRKKHLAKFPKLTTETKFVAPLIRQSMHASPSSAHREYA